MYLIMLGRSCSCWNIKKIKVNLRNHHTHNTIGQYLSVYIYIATILKMNIILSLKVSNEFFDLENLLKHVLHIEILQNMRHNIHCFIFSWRPF